jgi:hypothetical protein
MSFELSPSDRVRSHRVSNGGGLSILVTLLSPLLAVLLAQYLNTRQARQTTFLLPGTNVGASLPAERQPELSPELPAAKDPPKDPVQAWQAFALQPEKQARAKRLIAQANGAKEDPAGRFVMLRLAKDVATQANDGQTAFQAIDAMAKTFHADADAMKMSVLAKLASVAQKPAQHRSIAKQALKLENQAIGQDRLMVATQLSKLALAEAKRGLDEELLAKAQGRIADVAEQVRARERSTTLSGDR